MKIVKREKDILIMRSMSALITIPLGLLFLFIGFRDLNAIPPSSIFGDTLLILIGVLGIFFASVTTITFDKKLGTIVISTKRLVTSSKSIYKFENVKEIAIINPYSPNQPRPKLSLYLVLKNGKKIDILLTYYPYIADIFEKIGDASSEIIGVPFDQKPRGVHLG